MATNQTTNNNSIKSLENEKLNGSNFLKWYRKLRIILRNEQKLHHLEEALPEAPHATATVVVRNAYTRRVHAEQELFETIKAFHACKQEEGQSVSTYVLKMKAYLDKTDRLGYLMPLVLGVNLILTSLSKDYGQFVQNYNMHITGKTISELHVMLKLAEKVSKDNVFYFNVIPRDGIFESDMHKHVSNERSIYTCSNKKSKHNLYSTFLWHFCVGHINKKRIAKLQHDGLLKSTDDDSFDVCASCISGKMARKPFTHASERVDDLLRLIHSDVCGHLESCLEKEVENQLGKTIKVLRSDRRGEYLSQEFLDHLRSRGIVLQLTPPYTPQYNESATRMLNMVPSKKVDKTPYEIWHEKVLNLSYLKFFENSLISQEESESTVDFDENQSRDAQPSENTSKHQPEAEHENVKPQTTLSDPEFDKWLEAIKAKMKFMKDNQVWNLVDLPPNCKTVRSKWLFKKKTDMDGNIHSYKARLIGKGFTQSYRVDYEETFSHIADIKAIRILIAITAYYDYEIWQMDVKTAFLNGRLSEEVYMVQPKGFVNPKQHRRVCKLQRSIYRLKQAFRSWNKRSNEVIKKYGFTKNLDEPYVYMTASRSIVVFLILYVDDILLMGNNMPILQDEKSWLGKCFAMKDLGEAAYILGIKIYQDRLRCTRPDVVFSQNLTSRYQKNPGEIHWTDVKNILKYLRNTKDMLLVYGGDSSTKHNVTCAVEWKSSKQSTNVMSSTEAKYITASKAAMESNLDT
ncbi:retrotransposon protein, putative, ty1-copia subclass [Tanacetum coccineum]